MKIIDSIRALLAFPEEMRGILGEIHRLLLELSSRSHNMYKNLDELSLRSHDMYQNIVRLIKWQEEWGEHFKSISYSMQANDVDYNYIERGERYRKSRKLLYSYRISVDFL